MCCEDLVVHGWRATTQKRLCRVPRIAEIREHDFRDDQPTAAERAGLVARTTELLLRSHHCAVPEGDTCTSRRVFDALAAGCAPLMMGDVACILENLPFPHVVDWASLLRAVVVH